MYIMRIFSDSAHYWGSLLSQASDNSLDGSVKIANKFALLVSKYWSLLIDIVYTQQDGDRRVYWGMVLYNIYYINYKEFNCEWFWSIYSTCDNSIGIRLILLTVMWTIYRKQYDI